MTLEKKLNEFRSGDFIRIGTECGAGFIFAGRVRECDLRKIDRENMEVILTRIKKPVTKRSSRDGKARTEERLRHTALMKLGFYVPVACREVVEVYKTIRTDSRCRIIIIKGDESEGKDLKDYWENDLEIKELNMDGVRELAASMLRRAGEDLAQKNKELNRAMNDWVVGKQKLARLYKYEDKILREIETAERQISMYSSTCESMEKWLQMFDDADAIIDAARKDGFNA